MFVSGYFVADYFVDGYFAVEAVGGDGGRGTSYRNNRTIAAIA